MMFSICPMDATFRRFSTCYSLINKGILSNYKSLMFGTLFVFVTSHSHLVGTTCPCVCDGLYIVGSVSWCSLEPNCLDFRTGSAALS